MVALLNSERSTHGKPAYQLIELAMRAAKRNKHDVLLWTKTDLHPRRDTGQEVGTTDDDAQDDAVQ